MDDFLKPRIGFVGAGNIARFHINAARAVGFELEGICGQKYSNKAFALAHEFEFKNVVSSLEELMRLDLDAVCVLVNTSQTIEILERVSILELPILVEKPVFTSSSQSSIISRLSHNQITIGFNRRFYSAVQDLSGILQSEQHSNSNWLISELAWLKTSSINERISAVKENSVHIFDLMRYFYGELEMVSIEKHYDLNGFDYIGGLFKNNKGSVLNLSLNFNKPINSEIRINSNSNSFLLKPIEQLQIFDQISVFPPNLERPIKEYVPHGPIWKVHNSDLEFKPGFYRQYLEFFNSINGSQQVIGATLNDALKSIEIAEMLVKD